MLFFLSALACSIAPIEDRWSHGNITQLKDSFTSNFVIESEVDGERRWVVIDTGFNKNTEPLVDFLTEKEASIDDIAHVFITHGHGDHIGSHANFTNATFHVNSKDKSLLEAEGITAIETFEAGNELVLEGVSFLPFAVPGHTSGNVAVLVGEVLIMGDSAQSNKDGDIEVGGKRFAEDWDQAKASLEQLTVDIAPYSEQIEWIVFSHSGPIQGIDKLLSYSAE